MRWVRHGEIGTEARTGRYEIVVGSASPTPVTLCSATNNPRTTIRLSPATNCGYSFNRIARTILHPRRAAIPPLQTGNSRVNGAWSCGVRPVGQLEQGENLWVGLQGVGEAS